MTQERTEQRNMSEIREAFYRMIKGEHSLHVPAQTSDEDFVIGAALDELEAARAEIDRLNATIAGQAEAIREQTAKVQVVHKAAKAQDEEIDRLKKEVWEWQQNWQAEREKVQERDATIKDFADLGRENAKAIYVRDKEIERLRAALVAVRVNVRHIYNASYAASHIEKYAAVATGQIDEALEGAK